MNRPRCEVKGCERNALILFGNKWVCGEHYMKVREKQLEQQNKLLEDVEDEC